MGLNIEIKVDKNASNKGIKDYLDTLSKDSNFQSAIKVGIDDKEIQDISKTISKLSKMTINPLADGSMQAIKEFEMANGSILKIIEQINEEGIAAVESSSIQVNKTRQLTDYYKNMNKLLGDKLRLEKLIENSKGEDNRKANTQLKNIVAQIDAQDKLIKQHSLYNKNSTEQLEISRKAKMNEIELAKLKLKNTSGAQAEGYEKIFKSQEKEFKYRMQMLNASQEEVEVLQRKIEQEEKIQKSTQASLNARKLTDEKLQEALKLNREILSEEVKAKDVANQRTQAYSELIAIENRLAQKEKQLVGASTLASVELGTQISELRIKAMEKELHIQEKGLATEQEQAKLQEVRLKNAQELAVAQAKQDDKVITKEDEQAKTEKLKRQQKVYGDILSIEKQIATLSKQQVKTDVEEKKVELTKQINNLRQEQRDLEILAWREGLESAEKQAEVDQKRIQTAREIATIQAEQSGKKRMTQEDKEFNEVLQEQARLYNTLKEAVKEINTLQVKEVTAGEEERIVIQKQLNEAIEKEAQVRSEIATKQLQDVYQEKLVQNLKVAGVKRLEQVEAKQLDVLNKKAKYEQEELERANTLIERSKRALQIDLERLKVAKDAKYLDQGGLSGVQKAINNLNGTSTQQVQSQVNEIRLALRELGSNATIQRINSTSSAIDELKNGLRQLGTYASVAVIMRQLWQSFKQGIQYVKDLDEAFTDVAISMDITRDEFNSWTQDARKIAQANGVMTTSLMDMVKIYATAGESIDVIGDKLAGTAMIQNITQWDAEQTTSAVSSIINQYKLLDKEINGVTGNVANAIEYMGDALVGISNELTVDNVAGIQEMVNAIDVAGGVMEQSGATMEWYMAVTGTLNETMNATGSEIGNAFKMITARVFAQAQAMEDLGESAEDIEIEARKAEKALNSVGISIRDALNPAELRDMEDIMDDLAGKWDTLSDATKNYVAEGVAGTNRRSFFISMMENYDRVLELTNAGMNAQGELAKANEVRVQSLAGQINILKDKMYALMDGFEPVIRGTVQFGNVVLDLVNALGAVPSALGVVTASYLSFNESGKKLREDLTSLIPITHNLSLKWADQSVVLKETITQKRNTIEATQRMIASMNSAGMSTKNLEMGLKTFKGALLGAQVELVATTLKTVALQAAMSLGLSLAISAVSMGISKLIGWLTNYETSAQKAQKATEAVKTSSQELKELLGNGTESLLVDLEHAIGKLNKATGSYENQEKLMDSIASIKSDLVGIDGEYASILENEELSLEEQLAIIKEMRKEKLLMKAEELDSKWQDRFSETGGIDPTAQLLEKTKSNIEKMKQSIANAQNGVGQYNGQEFTLQQLRQMLSKQEELYKTHYQKIAEYNSDVNTMLSAGYDTSYQKVQLEEFRELFLQLTEDAKGLADSTGATGFDEFLFSEDEIRQASEDFVELSKNIQTAKDLIKDIQKNGMTIENAEQVLNTYKEFTGNIKDASAVQEYLNQQIDTMGEQANKAYSIMSNSSEDFWNSADAESEEYFANNIKNTSDWENFTIRVNSNLQQIHSTMIKNMGDEYSGYFDDIAKAYEIDVTNCKSAAEARLLIEGKYAEQVAELRKKALQASFDHGIGNGEYHMTAEVESAYQAIKDLQNWKNNALSALGNIPTFSAQSFSSTKPLGSSGSSTDKNSNNREVEDLKLTIDRYYEYSDALDDVNNKLEKNRLLQEQARDINTRKKLMQEEVTLMKEKATALEQLIAEQQREQKELRNSLSSNGFTFDGEGNVKNYEARLKALQASANALSGEAKEKAKENVQSIKDMIDAYTTLTNNTIPSTEQELISLRYELENINKEHEKTLALIETLGDRYYDLANAIKEVDNALALNQAKQENATAEERINLLKEELKLMQDKQKLLLQQKTEVEKESSELQQKLAKQGVEFNADGTIKNYKKLMESLTATANNLVGNARQEVIDDAEELIELINQYTTVIMDTLPQLELEWEQYATSIKDAQKDIAQTITDVQKQISSAIEEEYNKRYNKLKESLQKEKDLYNAQYEQEDWDNKLAQENRKLDEIKQQMSDLSRDTSLAGQLKLQQLREEYEAQQKVIDDMIRDKEKENGNNRFDEEMEKLDQELEDVLDPQNIADLVNKALVDGFVTIGNEVIELDTLMSGWLDSTGDGLYAIGDILKSELIDNLVVAQGLLSQMGLIDINTSGKGRSVVTTPVSTVGLSTQDYKTLEKGLQKLVQNNSQTGEQIVQIENLLTVQGNVVEDVLPQLQDMLNKARTEIFDELAQQVLTK